MGEVRTWLVMNDRIRELVCGDGKYLGIKYLGCTDYNRLIRQKLKWATNDYAYINEDGTDGKISPYKLIDNNIWGN